MSSISETSNGATNVTDSIKSNERRGNNAPIGYIFFRWFFKIILNVFYSSIIVENEEFVPPDGQPCIICANHSNSVMDAVVLVTSVSRKKRKMLRSTAKDTIVNGKGITSWLIRQMGPVPIMRPKDHVGKTVDNTASFQKLIEALEQGDAITLFPEGISRYHPEVAPLKTGVARITSDALTRNKDDPSFELTVLTCSVTYLHREKFRSSLLVSFNPPIKIRPQEHRDLLMTSDNDPKEAVKRLTKDMEEQIRGGTLDAPSWEILRIARIAQRLYAPLGTNLSLGEYIRLTQRFVDLFAHKKRRHKSAQLSPVLEQKQFDFNSSSSSSSHEGFIQGPEEIDVPEHHAASIDLLAKDLKSYQDTLTKENLKDDRIRTSKYLKPRHLYWRLMIRTLHTLLLSIIALPGLIFWTPIFIVAGRKAYLTAHSGPKVDVYDEVAQTKLLYGLGSGLIVYILTLGWSWYSSRGVLFTSVGVPLLMWFTLRWIEDILSAARSARSIFRMIVVGRKRLEELWEVREGLYGRVVDVATSQLGLPRNAEELVSTTGGMRRRLGYFSVKRRKKKDWNEVLRLYDVTEYGDEV